MTKPFNELPEGTFCIGANDDWFETKAKTLRGAKVIAGRTFQPAFGGAIEIGITAGHGETFRVETVAVKHGYGNWVDAP